MKIKANKKLKCEAASRPLELSRCIETKTKTFREENMIVVWPEKVNTKNLASRHVVQTLKQTKFLSIDLLSSQFNFRNSIHR